MEINSKLFSGLNAFKESLLIDDSSEFEIDNKENIELVNRVIKCKIYTNNKNKRMFRQWLGNNRFIWNYFLGLNKERYRENKKFVFYNEMWKELKELKKTEEYKWLNLSYSQSLQQQLKQLDIALRNAIKRHKKGEKIGFPKFKRKNYNGIVIIPQNFKISGNKVRIPKIGWIEIRDKVIKDKERWNYITKNVKQIMIKEEPDGFFMYIVYKSNKEPLEPNGNIVAIDVGLRKTIVLSDGTEYSLKDKEEGEKKSKYDKIMELISKIEELQSKIDKKKNVHEKLGIEGSKKLDELIRRRQKLYKKIKNIKRDFYYKVVNEILKKYEYVIVEDLNLANMMKSKATGNKHIDKKIHKQLQNISLGEFIEILKWEAELYGRKVIEVNPEYTSKRCSRCGYVNYDFKEDEIFVCPNCGFTIDRDLNATLNILGLGLKEIGFPDEEVDDIIKEEIEMIKKNHDRIFNELNGMNLEGDEE